MDYLGEDVAGEETASNVQAHNLESFVRAQVHPSNEIHQLSQVASQADQHTQVIDPTDEYDGMPPPAQAEFTELSDLLKYTQDHAARYGYATVTASNNYKRGIAYIRCDRGGKYVNHWGLTDENRVRKQRQRRLVGCLWKARAKKNGAGLWVMTMMHDKHNNHGPSKDAASHPSQRQLSDDAKESARKAFHDKQSPKFVLGMLQTNFNPAVTAQDVYNLKAKINREDETRAAQGLPPAGQITETTNRMIEPDIPTDPALQMPALNLVQQPAAAHKCQCKCCDH